MLERSGNGYSYALDDEIIQVTSPKERVELLTKVAYRLFQKGLLPAQHTDTMASVLDFIYETEGRGVLHFRLPTKNAVLTILKVRNAHRASFIDDYLHFFASATREVAEQTYEKLLDYIELAGGEVE